LWGAPAKTNLNRKPDVGETSPGSALREGENLESIVGSKGEGKSWFKILQIIGTLGKQLPVGAWKDRSAIKAERVSGRGAVGEKGTELTVFQEDKSPRYQRKSKY